ARTCRDRCATRQAGQAGSRVLCSIRLCFFFQAEDGIRDRNVTGVQTCALPIWIMRKGEFAIHPGVMRITFHDPVPTEGCAIQDRARIMDAVRRAILSGLTPGERPVEAVTSDK